MEVARRPPQTPSHTGFGFGAEPTEARALIGMGGIVGSGSSLFFSCERIGVASRCKQVV
jgi:hypothetical protein